ncbi:hypothetical protein ACFY93_02840 [Streptomyces sp. NPDC008313]|uniref:hypothetical protein n=1 Tax=Streptomyces sp. NPDC008313 TaxID=3364826 RepID=UPI0036E8ACC8
MSDSMTGPEPEPAAGTGADEGVNPDAAAGPDEDTDAGPAPLGVPRTPTGDPGTDALLERLADADHLGTEGHLAVYEDVHRGLRDALTALDARQGSPVPSAPTAPTPSYDRRS